MKQIALSLSLMTLLLTSACQAPQSSQPNQPNTPNASAQPGQSTIATIPVGKSPHGIGKVAGFIYNSNSAENTISVIDPKTDKVVKTLTLSEGHPGYIKASHNDKYAFVLNPDAGKIHIFAPGQEHALVQTIEVGKAPDRIQLSADDSKAWVSLAGEAAIAELSFGQGLDKAPSLRKINVGKPADGEEHRALAQGLGYLATPNSADNNVSLVNLNTGAVSAVTAGNGPSVVGLGSWDNADRSLIIGNSASNTVTLYHLETQIPVTLQDVGQGPTDIAVLPDNTRAFITMAGSNEVAVIDYRQQKVLARIPVGQRPVHIYSVPAEFSVQHGDEDHNSPQQSEIWVSNDTGNTISIIDPYGLKLKSTQAVGKGHHKLAFWNQKAYVSNISEATVTVLDRSRFGD